MLLFPKKPNYVKSFSNKKKNLNFLENKNVFRFSYLTLIADDCGYIPNHQIEAIRLFFETFFKKTCTTVFSNISKSTNNKKNQMKSD
jgi:hypothetical protein